MDDMIWFVIYFNEFDYIFNYTLFCLFDDYYYNY